MAQYVVERMAVPTVAVMAGRWVAKLVGLMAVRTTDMSALWTVVCWEGT